MTGGDDQTQNPGRVPHLPRGTELDEAQLGPRDSAHANFERFARGEPIAVDAFYRVQAQRGPQPCVADAPGAVYGRSLADLDTETFTDARSLKDAKRVLRAALDACLDGRALKSREVMLAMRRRAT